MFHPSILYMTNEQAIEKLSRNAKINQQIQQEQHMNQEIIYLTSLLAKAQEMLITEYSNKEIFINGTLKPENWSKPKEAGDERTRLWLEAKTKHEMERMAALACQISKLIDPSECDKKEEAAYTEKQRRAIALILENEKVAENVSRLADKLGEEHA